MHYASENQGCTNRIVFDSMSALPSQYKKIGRAKPSSTHGEAQETPRRELDTTTLTAADEKVDTDMIAQPLAT